VTQHADSAAWRTSAGGAGGAGALPPSAAATFCWSSGFSDAKPCSCSVPPTACSDSGATDSLLAETWRLAVAAVARILMGLLAQKHKHWIGVTYSMREPRGLLRTPLLLLFLTSAAC
jgi:hypothetical protein